MIFSIVLMITCLIKQTKDFILFVYPQEFHIPGTSIGQPRESTRARALDQGDYFLKTFYKLAC